VLLSDLVCTFVLLAWVFSSEDQELLLLEFSAPIWSNGELGDFPKGVDGSKAHRGLYGL
jgi:hypothetical protein